MQPLSPTMGISEAARRLNVSETRVRQLIERGKLIAVPGDSGYRRVQRESLEKLAANRRQT